MLARLRSPLSVYALVCAITLLSIAFSVSKMPGDPSTSAARYLTLANPKLRVYTSAAETKEIDYVELLRTIGTKDSFAETFNFWHEPWRLDTDLAAYWRPLTMQLFWLENRAFRSNHPYNWVRISILAQVIYTLLFAALLYKLTNSPAVTLITTLVISFPREWLNPIPFLPTTYHTPSMLLLEKGWKDQPDLFANIFILATLLLALNRRWYLALACAAIAVCFKESGWLAFVLMPAALWATRFAPPLLPSTRSTHTHVPKSASGGEGVRGRGSPFTLSTLAVILLLLALRWSAGPAVFFAHTRESNSGWLTEYLHSVSSIAFFDLRFFAEALIALAIAYVFTKWSPSSVLSKLAIVGGAMICALVLSAIQHQVTLQIAPVLLLQGFASVGLQLLLWLALFIPLVLDKDLRLIALAFILLGMVAAAPHAATSQANLHTLSLAIYFQSVFVGCMILAAHRALAAKLSTLGLRRTLAPSLTTCFFC